MSSFRHNLSLVGCVSTVFFFNVGARAVFAPILPAVEADLGLGHAQAGSLFLILTVGYGAGLLCSGLVTGRLSLRSTIALSSAGVGAALLALAAHRNLGELRAGLAALGFAAGLYLPAGVGAITTVVAPGDWGKALALHELAPNLSFAVTPFLAEALLGHLSWRGALAAFGAPPLAAGLLALRLPEIRRAPGAPAGRAALAPLLATPAFWVLSALFGLGIGLSFGVFAMLPLYLTAGLGFGRAWSNHLVALARVLALTTVFGAGWLADRLGPRRALTATLAAGAAATALLGLVPPGALSATVLVQAAMTAWFFPALFAALSAVSPLAVSLASPLAMLLGGGAVPTLIGALADRGLFQEAFVALGGVTLGAALLAARLKWTPSPAPEAEGHGRPDRPDPREG